MNVLSRIKRLSFGVVLFLVIGPSCVSAEESVASQRSKVRAYLKGLKLYERQCLPCHGPRGRGDGPWSKDLIPKPRNFRSGLFKYRTTAYGMLPTDDDLRRTIRAGISGTAMPSFESLEEGEVDLVIRYIKSLSKKWNEEQPDGEPLPIPKTPEWFGVEADLMDHARVGRARFAVLCASCHGPEGKGDGPLGAGLRDFWQDPIRPANLQNEHHKSGDRPRDLYRTIATGLNGTPMVGFWPSLDKSDIWDLVAFIKWNEAALSKGKTGTSAETEAPE